MKIKDFAFNPLKGGAFSITATVTPEMVEEAGGKIAMMQQMIPLMGSEFAEVTTPGVSADAIPQDETNTRIMEMLEGIKLFVENSIDSNSQTEMALDDIGGIGVDTEGDTDGG